MARPEEATNEADSYHYRVVARAIAILDESGGQSLPLDELAARLGMSAAHFQRIFSRWAGVSPKRYQQYLTLDHAKRLLADRHSLLDTSLAAGMSGTGRLHDLFLRWEAMSPGTYARAGAGLVLRHATFETPFGPAVGVASEHGLCGLAFASGTSPEAALADLAARWPAARLLPDDGRVADLVAAAFGARQGPVALHAIGAPFQIKVWEALLQIPSGSVTTYGDIARSIGQPAAVRAVGTAVGRNPLGYLIPCHRVIRKGGELGGYRWGLPVKRAILAWESARAEADHHAA